MAEQSTLQALGLRTSANEIGSTPNGGLIKAQNCMLLARGLMGSRRGQPRLAYGFGVEGNDEDGNALTIYGTTPIVQYTDDSGDGRLTRDTGSAFSDYSGIYDPPDPALLRMKFQQTADNLYFTTTKGVYRLDGTTRTPSLSGGPRTWGLRLGDYVESTTGFLASGESVAYRVVFGVKDDHGRVYLGPPSSRLVVTNPTTLGSYATGTLTISGGAGSVGGTVNATAVTVTWGTSDDATATDLAQAMNASAIGSSFLCTAVYNVVTITALATGTAGNVALVASGTGVTASGVALTGGAASGGPCNVSLSITLAEEMPATTFWQLYRSAVYPSGETPNDELFLVNEAWFTGIGDGDTLLTQNNNTLITQSSDTLVTQIADVDVLDDTPNLFAISNAAIYTASSRGDGILQSNEAPPLCKDVTWWDNRAWYANISRYQEQLLAIIGVGVGANGSTGIRYSDQIIFGDVVLTAGTEEDAQTGTFRLYLPTDSTDSLNVSEAIGATAESVVYVLNQQAGTYAQMANGVDVGSDGRFLYQGAAYDDPEVEIVVRSSVLSVSSITGTGAVSTLICYTPGTLQYAIHGLVAGDTVYIYSQTPPSGLANGTYTVLATNLTSYSFNVASTQSGTVSTSGTTIQRVSPAANLAWRPQPPPAVFSVAAGDLFRLSGVVSVVTDTIHGLLAGQMINLQPADALDANFPAGFKTIATVDSAQPYSFTYNEAGADGASTTAYQSGSRVTTTNNAAPQTIVPSKIQEQEAVPRINDIPVGTTDANVLRVVPLDQFLYVFKTDGIYIVSPDSLSVYRWQLLDDTTWCIAPDTVCVCNHRVFALTNKGVVEVNSGGVVVLSTPEQIAQELFQYYGTDTIAALKVDSWAVARETDGLYIMGVPTLENEDEPFDVPRMYVYSTRANEWTTWEKSWYSAVVRKSDDQLIFLAPASISAKGTLAFENNTKTAADYADGTLTLDVLSYDIDALTITVASATGVEVGDVISFAGQWVVTAINGAVLTVTNTPAEQTLSVVVSGAPASITTGGNATAAAAELAAAINALPSPAVSAVGASNVVNMTAVSPYTGAAGNAVSISATAPVTASGAFLTGGVDGAYAFMTNIVVQNNGAGTYGLTVAGTPVTVSWAGSATLTAVDLVTALNADPTVSALVTATRPFANEIIRLDADEWGTAGNAITVTTPNANVSVPAGTLSGGTAGTTATGSFTVPTSFLGTATCYRSFPIVLQWREHDGGAPADIKEYREVHLHHRWRDYYKATLTYSTDLVTTEQTQVVYPAQTPDDATPPVYTADGGMFPGRPVPPKKVRVAMDQSVARGSYFNFGFTIREAFALWFLNGITLVYERVSSKGSR